MTPQQFESTVQEASEAACRAAQAVLRSAADAQDVAQDVMLKLWTLRNEVRDAAEMLRLASVMGRRRAIDWVRKGQRTLLTDTLPTTVATDALPDAQMESDEAMRHIMALMEQLPPAEYQILRMRQVEGKNNGEIARLLNIKPQSVASLLSRARHRMQEMMRKHGAEYYNIRN